MIAARNDGNIRNSVISRRQECRLREATSVLAKSRQHESTTKVDRERPDPSD